MDSVSYLATSISILAITLPLAASIWRARVNGNKVDVTEYEKFKSELGKRLEEIQFDIKSLMVLLTNKMK